MRKYSSSSEETTTIEKRFVPEFESKPRQLLDSRKQLHDGIDFKPSLSIGITSNVFELSEEEEICYISGNQYALASSIDANNMTVQYLPCNAIGGSVTNIQILKNKKVSMVASLQTLETPTAQINKINYFSRRDQAHRDIVITAKGKPLGFVILLDGKVGFLLLDQSTEMVNKFMVFFVNVERENVLMRLDKPHKAIKIISSTMGDYNLILCSTVIYEVEVGLTEDAELIEFQVKQFLDEGEFYIEGGFVKSSFNLLLITNNYNVLLFDHHKLLSKHQLNPISIQRPLITNVQAGISQIVIELQNKRLCVFNLRSREFQFGGYINMLESYEGEYRILDFKIMRREIYIMIQQKTIEIWRVSLRSKGQENLQLLSNNVSLIDYNNPPALEIVAHPVTIKEMLTVHSDGILRVWDLNKGLKGSKPLFEHVYCLSVHPVGSQLFVGFKQYGRIYALAGFQLEIKCSLKIRGLLACKYTLDGQYLLLQQGSTIYQYNAYSYTSVRSITINLNNVSRIDFIDNVFYLQNDNYLGLYTLEGARILQKRTNCYDSTNQCLVFSEGNSLHVCVRSGEAIESDERVELVLEENEKITVIKLVDMLGIILVATSKGNLLELMYPLPEEKRDSFYKYKAAESSIVDLIIHQTHQALTLITEDSIITTFDFIQLLEGQKTTTIYTISKEDKITGSGNRKSIMNRQYMFKGFELESTLLEAEKAKEIMELEFYTENFVNESEEKRVRIKVGLQEELDGVKVMGSGQCEEVAEEVRNLRSTWGEKISTLNNQISENKSRFQKEKEELINSYEQKLLTLIHKDKSLRTLKQHEEIRLRQIIEKLGEKQREIAVSLLEERESQYAVLYNKLIQISKELKGDREKADMITEEVEGEYRELISSVTKELDDELERQQSKNRSFNISISKLKQQISIFTLRRKQLQNVIDQMQKQIKQLQQIREQYQLKKQQMEGELQDKQVIINSKEQELKKIFTENKNRKNLKDIHQYLMSEYQKELEPGEMKRNELLGKVKQMNMELNHETQWRVEIKKQVKEAEGKIEELKGVKQKMRHQNVDINNRLESLGHEVRRTMGKEPSEWMEEFRTLGESLKGEGFGDTQMMEREQKPIVTNKMIAKVIVGKEEIHRKILESEKATVWQEKHKEGVYKKIQNENIELVKEHNLLQIEKKHLQEHVDLLKASMAMVEEADGVSLKRKSASLGVLTHRPMIKATPFQLYTAQQDETKKRFSTIDKPLSSTRLKPISNSSAWMKGVVQDIIKSKNQVGNIIQRKISSFANPNPEKSKMRKIISLHSHESSDKGEKMSRIFNNVVLQGSRERVMSGHERINSGRKS